MTIKEIYQKKRPVISFEIFPPKKDADIETIYKALERMSLLVPDFISVTYGAGGVGRINKTAEIAAHIQNLNAVPALAHLTCMGAKEPDIAHTLDLMLSAGIKNVLVLRGDLPEGYTSFGGDYRYAYELLASVKKHGGFCAGAACYPEGHISCEDLSLDIERLRQKQEAGADFLISQLFFDNDIFYRFLERARKAGITVPVSAGVMPILSRKQIERMIFMCGASLPSGIIKLLHKYENDCEGLRQAGIERAAVQIEGLIRENADGVHIYTMNKPDIAEYCVKHIGGIKR